MNYSAYAEKVALMTNPILYDRHPNTYLHWSLGVSGAVATLTLSIDEEGGLVPGYKLKLNSWVIDWKISLNVGDY